MIKWKQIGVVGLAIFTILLAVNVTGIGIAYWFDSKLGAGDILSFEGALLGTAGAVLGALYLEESKRRQQNSEQQRPILDAISNLRATLVVQKQAETLGEIYTPDVQEAFSILKAIFSFYPPKTPLLMAERRQTENQLDDYIGSANYLVKYEAEYSPGNPLPLELKAKFELALAMVNSLEAAYKKSGA